MKLKIIYNIYLKKHLAVSHFPLETAGFTQSGEDLYLDRDGTVPARCPLYWT